MLKPSRVSARASVNTSAVPRLSEVDNDAGGVYDTARPLVTQPGPRPANAPRMGGPSRGGSGQEATSIQVRLSGKKGEVRGEAQTGRRDLCGRQVMTCWNYKSVTEMIISPSIAHNLKRLETVNPLNLGRLTELQLRGRITTHAAADNEELFLPYNARFMYEPRVGDVVVDTRFSALDPRGHQRYPVRQAGVLPVPAIKPYHAVVRRGKLLDPTVPAALQPLPLGSRIERPMEPGDIGMRLRNPCIYESSIFAQKYVCPDPRGARDVDPTTETEHTSRRNTSEALAQRGDFDGDDNTIIANRGQQADAEVMRLMTPQAVFLSSKDGSACMYPTQDSALGLWALTMHSAACAPLVLDNRVVDDLLFEINVPPRRCQQLQASWDEYARAHPAEPNVVVYGAVEDTLRCRPCPFAHTALGLFSSILPADLCYVGAGLTVVRGVLVEGVAHADVWSRHLLPFVHRVCGADAAIAVLDRAERLGALVAERIGPSISCFSDNAMLEDARVAVQPHLAEIRAAASRRCATLPECEVRNYMLHHKLLAVQNAAQRVTERHVTGPLFALPGAAKWVRGALRAVGAPPAVFDELVAPFLPAAGQRYDYQWVRANAARVAEGLCQRSLGGGGAAGRVLLALCQPRWTVARAEEEESGSLALGPQPDLAQHRADAELRRHAFLTDVDPTAAYCAGSRSVAIGTVSQMRCMVGQLFSDNGDVQNRRGGERAELAPDRDVQAYMHTVTAAHCMNRTDWSQLSDTVGSEASGMVMRSFTQGLSSRAMHVMGTTIRSTLANSGNGTRRAGHLARLISIYGENFSVKVLPLPCLFFCCARPPSSTVCFSVGRRHAGQRARAVPSVRRDGHVVVAQGRDRVWRHADRAPRAGRVHKCAVHEAWPLNKKLIIVERQGGVVAECQWDRRQPAGGGGTRRGSAEPAWGRRVGPRCPWGGTRRAPRRGRRAAWTCTGRTGHSRPTAACSARTTGRSGTRTGRSGTGPRCASTRWCRTGCTGRRASRAPCAGGSVPTCASWSTWTTRSSFCSA